MSFQNKNTKCIVHQIRNSLKHIASKDQNVFILALTCTYKTVNKDIAELELLIIEEKRTEKHPVVPNS